MLAGAQIQLEVKSERNLTLSILQLSIASCFKRMILGPERPQVWLKVAQWVTKERTTLNASQKRQAWTHSADSL